MSKAGAYLKKGMKATQEVVHGKLRTTIPAGMAAAGPPLGPMLGQRGINIAAFCKDFNNQTAHYVEGVPLPTRVTVNPDRSYKMTILNPESTFLIKQAAGLTRGAMDSGSEVAGWITLKHVYEIAVIKSRDPPLELTPLKQICELVIGTARSCGIEIVRDYDPVEYGRFLESRVEVEALQFEELKEKRESKLLRK